jgi:hypothetical protein
VQTIINNTTANSSNDTSRPICINGYYFNSSINQCQKTTPYNSQTANKTYTFISGLSFGNDPHENDMCLNVSGIQYAVPANAYTSDGNCYCNSGYVYNGLTDGSAGCNIVSPASLAGVVGGWHFEGGYGCRSDSNKFTKYGNVPSTSQDQMLDLCDGTWMFVNNNYCPPGTTHYFSRNWNQGYHFGDVNGLNIGNYAYLVETSTCNWNGSFSWIDNEDSCYNNRTPTNVYSDDVYWNGILLNEFCR